MQPSSMSWDDFQSRKATAPEQVEGALVESIRQVRARKRPTPAPKGNTLADVLLQAVEIASTRKGRISQSESVREQTLLEVLQHALRRKA